MDDNYNPEIKMSDDEIILQHALEYTDSMMWGDKKNAEKELDSIVDTFRKILPEYRVTKENAWEYLKAELIRRKLDKEYDYSIQADFAYKPHMKHLRKVSDENAWNLEKEFNIDNYLINKYGIEMSAEEMVHTLYSMYKAMEPVKEVLEVLVQDEEREDNEKLLKALEIKQLPTGKEPNDLN